MPGLTTLERHGNKLRKEIAEKGTECKRIEELYHLYCTIPANLRFALTFLEAWGKAKHTDPGILHVQGVTLSPSEPSL